MGCEAVLGDLCLCSNFITLTACIVVSPQAKHLNGVLRGAWAVGRGSALSSSARVSLQDACGEYLWLPS